MLDPKYFLLNLNIYSLFILVFCGLDKIEKYFPPTLKCHIFMNPEVRSSHCLCDLQNTDHLCALHFTGRN